MDLALPHVIIRSCGPEVGAEVAAALSLHPVEVSEARDASEMSRVAGGRPAVLVVVIKPPDTRAAIAEAWAKFPRVPILLVSAAPDPRIDATKTGKGWVDWVADNLPLQTICWHVMEAIGRAALLPNVASKPIGPIAVLVDKTGTVLDQPSNGQGLLIDGRLFRPGDSFLSLIDPADRDLLARVIERSAPDEVLFTCGRVLNERDGRHVVSVGVRNVGNGSVTLLVQPVISGGPIVGRHVNNRDPITGLLTRWAISRRFEKPDTYDLPAEGLAVLFVRLEDFSAIGEYIGARHTDVVLVRVASVLGQVFPFPAVTSRLIGDAFLVGLPGGSPSEAARRAAQLIHAINGIDVPGFALGFMLRASVGIADVTDTDHDLAIRLAESAVAKAQAAGGNRTVVAGSGDFTGEMASELNGFMDVGSWEVWLQPVARSGDGRPAFHEALARFDSPHRSMVSRADLFRAGRAQGLLERFDHMMLLRNLCLLESHPEARLSVNVTYETFVSPSFPTSYLGPIRGTPNGCDRIILEISPRCMAASNEIVRCRLEQLATAGVAVAIDDFGSGICRLEYLTQMPIAYVKLDELVTGYVADDPLQREFVRTVSSICHARGITVVAEYTRSREQLARLVEDGVDLFQGELFGMPRPAEEVLRAFPAEVPRA